MAVLNRKLFNRGGPVSSRGVGITSGLVKGYEHGGPVSEHTKMDNITSDTQAYYDLLTHEDSFKRIEAAKAWSVWEGSTVKLIQNKALMEHSSDAQFAEAFSRIECHYFTNNGWFDTDNYLIENVDKIRHIPAVIVHGRYDVVCPVENAWELHKAWPESDLHIIPDSGHAMSEEGIKNKLIEYTDKFLKF